MPIINADKEIYEGFAQRIRHTPQEQEPQDGQTNSESTHVPKTSSGPAPNAEKVGDSSHVINSLPPRTNNVTFTYQPNELTFTTQAGIQLKETPWLVETLELNVQSPETLPQPQINSVFNLVQQLNKDTKAKGQRKKLEAESKYACDHDNSKNDNLHEDQPGRGHEMAPGKASSALAEGLTLASGQVKEASKIGGNHGHQNRNSEVLKNHQDPIESKVQRSRKDLKDHKIIMSNPGVEAESSSDVKPGEVHVKVYEPQIHDRDAFEDGPEYSVGCITCKKFRVGRNLRNNWKVQGAFFTKIVLIKALQLFAMNIWMFILGFIPVVKNHFIAEINWIYLAVGLYFVFLVTFRSIAQRRSKWPYWLTTIFLVLVTLDLGYALSSVSVAYDEFSSLIHLVTWTLMFTFLILAFTPYIVQVPMTDDCIARSGGIVILFVSVILLIISRFLVEKFDMVDFATFSWLPSVLISEAVLWITIKAIQRTISGWNFHVTEKRWLFTSLFV